jgi:hypothetical protein
VRGPGRRAVVAAAVVLLALVAARSVEATRGTGSLRAGAAAVALRVPPGTPLGGYGASARRLPVPDVLGRHPHAFWFRPHQGQLDPLRGRALVLEDGAARLVWVAADLVAVDRGFTAALRDRLGALGLGDAALIVSASHTHSGPGAHMDVGLLGALSVDRHDPAVRGALLDSLSDAVRRAAAARTPARVGTAAVPGPPVVTSRLGRPLDPELVVLKVVAADGAPIAAVWSYPIHGTMLGPGNRQLSGDVMGVASRDLEQALGVPALFVNAAVGDVSPHRHGHEAAREVGRTLAAAVRGAWDRIAPAGPTPLAVRAARVALPAPHLSLRNCASARVPRWLTLPLGWIVPRDAELVAAAVGSTAWVTGAGRAPDGARARREGGGPSALAARLRRQRLQRLPGLLRHASRLRPDRVRRVHESLRADGRRGPQSRGGRRPARPRRRPVSVRGAGYPAGRTRRRARADFLRAAVFRCTTPFVTALSSVRMASATAVRASASPPASAWRAALIVVRTLDRTIRLRRRRFSFCRIRLIADFVFAT